MILPQDQIDNTCTSWWLWYPSWGIEGGGGWTTTKSPPHDDGDDDVDDKHYVDDDDNNHDTMGVDYQGLAWLGEGG